MDIKIVPHHPYSPDLAPCDFWLFPKLRGYRYERIEEMKEAVTKVIDMLTQEDFHGAFEKLLERHNKCFAAGGDYFEGDESFMCVLSIKVPIRKSLETYLMSLVSFWSIYNSLHMVSFDDSSSFEIFRVPVVFFFFIWFVKVSSSKINGCPLLCFILTDNSPSLKYLNQFLQVQVHISQKTSAILSLGYKVPKNGLR